MEVSSTLKEPDSKFNKSVLFEKIIFISFFPIALMDSKNNRVKVKGVKSKRCYHVAKKILGMGPGLNILENSILYPRDKNNYFPGYYLAFYLLVLFTE